jgi:dephospho-CoA kinase
MPLVYVTGVPGVGKSVVRGELRARGFAAYGTDEDGVGAFYDLDGDRVTPDQVVSSPTWRARHVWKIVVDKIDQLATMAEHQMVFVCGSAANEAEVWPRFDRVIALVADERVLRQRLRDRTGNDFAKSPDELAVVLEWQRTYADEARSYGAVVIDSARPLRVVVDDVVAAATAPDD